MQYIWHYSYYAEVANSFERLLWRDRTLMHGLIDGAYRCDQNKT